MIPGSLLGEQLTVWSIHSWPAWCVLQQRGFLRSHRRYAWREFLEAYEWMARQMDERLAGPRPSKRALPVWAWHQHWSARRRRPDLRSTGHLPKGTKGVRLECTVAADRILLSDFELWHYVLNGWYLADSEADSREFDRMVGRAKPCDHVDIQRRITASWGRIFDIDWCDPGHWVAAPLEEKQIQATLWELRKEDIVRVTEFVAR